EPPEARGTGDVRPLADHHEARVRPDLERLQPAEPWRGAPLRDLSRDLVPGQGHDGLDVFGRGAAAAADDVHEAVLGELVEVPAGVGGLLVVRAELVGEAGVRVA